MVGVKNKRVSQYNSYLRLNRIPGKSLIIQGYRGSFDVVDNEVADILKSKPEDIENCGISPEMAEKLASRGYITEFSEEEEYEFIGKVSDALGRAVNKSVNITILPTYNCNFRCEYCFERNLQCNGQDWLNSRMSTETADAIFRQIAAYKEEGRRIDSVYLFGGEPLLYSSMEIVCHILEKCKEMEIPIHIVTNGYDLHHYIDILKQYNIASMQITLDGLKDDHDSRRFLVGGKGSYDRIVQNIGLALEAGVPITLRTNVNKKNLESIIDLVNDYNMREWVKYPNFRYYFKSTLRCYEEIGDALSDVELMAKVHELFGTDAGRFHFNSIYGTLSDRIEYMLRTGSFAPLRSGFCGANTNMYTIDPFGDIYPCWDVLSEKECRIGKLDTEKGRFVLNEHEAEWKGRRVDKIDDCKKCRHMLFCGGGCSAQAKVINSDINKVFCDDFETIFDEVAVRVCEEHLLAAKNKEC